MKEKISLIQMDVALGQGDLHNLSCLLLIFYL